MSTTSPVTSLEAAASPPCSCSCAIASGAHAKPAMKIAVTATLNTVGLFVELNIRLIWAAQRFGQSVAADWRPPLLCLLTHSFRSDRRTDRKNTRHHAGRARLPDDIAR